MPKYAPNKMPLSVKKRYFELLRERFKGAAAARVIGVSASCGSNWFLDAGGMIVPDRPVSSRFLCQAPSNPTAHPAGSTSSTVGGTATADRLLPTHPHDHSGGRLTSHPPSDRDLEVRLDGSGEAAALVLRPGNAGSNTAADHIAAGRLALNQIPSRPHKQVIIRTDSGGDTHEFLDWVTARRIKYSIAWGLTDDICAAIGALPEHVWQCAYDADRRPRLGAWVAELTGMLDLSSWPKGMRVIVRRERPHPGAQLRFTDIDGHRFT